MRYCVDANVFITAWNDDYPQDVFPKVYTEIKQAVNDIIIIKPIFDEIDPISPSHKKKSESELRELYPLRMWLIKDAQIEPTPIGDDVKDRALQLEAKYETKETGRGANKNDIKLIAYALINKYTVVTLEGMQKDPPKKKCNYKIPLICQKCQDEVVDCIDFVELLRKLNIKI